MAWWKQQGIFFLALAPTFIAIYVDTRWNLGLFWVLLWVAVAIQAVVVVVQWRTTTFREFKQ